MFKVTKLLSSSNLLVSQVPLTVTVTKIIGARNIASKHMRIKHDKPKPFPYDKKKYRWWCTIWDNTYKRFDENSKIIVIDGPVASGKTELAKRLADELEMVHIQEPTMDLYYINQAGYNMRQLDATLPERCRSFDEKNFLETPDHYNCPVFQLTKLKLRYSIYLDALNHLFNTGDGMVLERSPYSDTAFVHAMHDCGYLSKNYMSYYKELLIHINPFIMRPHLIIYLDVPVDKVQENIKKRNIPYEVNSPALTPKFLSRMEYHYKHKVLKELGTHSKLLIYDWSEGGDFDVIVEDIERIDDFDSHDRYGDPVLHDWNLEPWEYDVKRNFYSCQKFRTMMTFNCIQRLDIPELLFEGNEMAVLEKQWCNAPGLKYSKGYDPLVDTNIFWKVRNYEGWCNNG